MRRSKDLKYTPHEFTIMGYGVEKLLAQPEFRFKALDCYRAIEERFEPFDKKAPTKPTVYRALGRLADDHVFKITGEVVDEYRGGYSSYLYVATERAPLLYASGLIAMLGLVNFEKTVGPTDVPEYTFARDYVLSYLAASPINDVL